MLRAIFACAASVALVGCASQIGAFYNRPVIEDSAKTVVTTLALASDRRTVVVATEGKNIGKFCAEPPPDTATGLKAELEASAEARVKAEQAKLDAEGKLSGRDKFETNIVVLAQRTPELDAFRTGVYALCQYHLNGALKEGDVSTLFVKLIDAFAHPKPAVGTPAE